MLSSTRNSSNSATIGIVALHGDARSHKEFLLKLGVDSTKIKFIKKPEDLENVDGLILPGGESTTMSLLGERYGIFDLLRSFVTSGKPVWGTCAGLILLSDKLDDKSAMKGQTTIGGLKVTVCRNFFGSQNIAIKGISDDEDFPAVFIRAPVITEISDGVEVLATANHETPEGKKEKCIVAVKQGNILGTSFHPELTKDTRFHEYFLKLVDDSLTKV